MQKSKVFSIISTNFVKISTFLVSLSLSFGISKSVFYLIRTGNPHSISNLYYPNGFSPEQNYTRILLVIILTVTLYYLFSKIIFKYPRAFKLFICLLFTFTVFVSVLMPELKKYENNIDTFHHGEQLSPGNAFNGGKGLYTDLYVLHGAGEDVLIPALSLNLAKDGNGISTYFFVIITLQVLSVFLFSLLLSRIFKSIALFLLTSAWFLFSVYSSFHYVRDIFIWSLLLLVIYVIFDFKVKYKNAAYAGMGLTSSGLMFYAIDRGFIALIISGFTAVVATLFVTTKTNLSERRASIPKKLNDIKILIYYTLGLLLAQLTGLILMGFNQYLDFLKLTFSDIPKFQGMLFSRPLPVLETDSFPIWLPVVIASLGIIMLVNLTTRKILEGKITNEILFSWILLLGGILFLKVGYGRPDFGHISYSTPLLLIAVFYIMAQFFQQNNLDTEKLWLPVLLVLLLFIPVNALESKRFFNFLDLNVQQVGKYTKLLDKNDSYWLPSDVSKVSDYIKSNTSSDDNIFVYTQQPIYYYLTDRDNPTRFYITWFADPTKLEEEMLADLKSAKPKIIVYSSGNFWDNIDGINMSKRTPKVEEWINTNYHETVMIDQVKVLKR